MLHIPRAEENSTHELLRVNNLGHYWNGVLIKLNNVSENAIQKTDRIYSIDFWVCKGRGNNWLCPEKAISVEDCSEFNTYENCMLAVEVNNQYVFHSAQYLTNYYIVTSYSNYTKRGIVCELTGHNVALTNLSDSIAIGHHELTACRGESIVEVDDLKPTDDDRQIYRYIQKGLSRIPHLRADWEGLKKEATQIDHLWNKEQEQIKSHTEKAEELFKSQNLFCKIWIWGLNTNIHPWIHVIFYIVLILQLIILLVFL
ncbi:hypothetical protein scyTo_0020004 [Scyliorhinus torazame]|uniref:Uncharacterized protein n=1 Tax=Scyliorhinus torazame TaxID=75743 RepID=A0A401PWP9_SCYTO|nr:hypothetical protein [Scyliorhinus torazame]